MKPTKEQLKALRVRVAELLGWTKIKIEYYHDDDTQTLMGWNKGYYEGVPKYSTSLDEMHEAEKTLSGEEWGTYCKALEHIVRSSGDHLEIWRDVNPSRTIDALQIHAEAHQKAAAFIQAKAAA